MPLQIRRGTEAERTALVPSNGLVVGELLYVTDEQRVFIGTGIAGQHQGLAVTGFTSEDAVDAVGSAILAGSHSNITFTYGTDQDNANRIDARVDLSNYVGTIAADAFRGSVFGDDTSLLIDAISGTVVCPVVADVTGDLTGNVNGNVTGNVTGNLSGNVTGTVTGILTGSVIGDVKGSVFADDSVTMVDSVNSILSNGTINLESNRISSIGGTTPFGYVTDAVLIGSEASPNIIVSYGDGVLASFVGTTAGSFNSSSIQVRNARGTLETPLASAAGDLISPIQGYAYDGVDWNLTGSFGMATDPDVAIGVGAIAGTFFVSAYDETGSDARLVFNSKGALIVPIVQTGSYTSTQRDALTAAVGMMIYNTTANKFQGYQNTGGTTLEWVDLS